MKTLKELETKYNISKEELQCYYDSHTNTEVAAYLGLSKTQTLRIIDAFGLTKKVAFKSHVKLSDLISTIGEDNFKSDYYKMTQNELAIKYNISVKQVVEIRDKLGLNYRKVHKTLDEYNIDCAELKSYYYTHTLDDTAKHFEIGSIMSLKNLLLKYNIPIENRISGYVEDLKTKISKDELQQYYQHHTLKETEDYFGIKVIGQLIKYYGITKSKSHESFESIVARINKDNFITDFNSMNIYELFKKYNIAYTSYRKLLKEYNLQYKPGIFAFQDASMSKDEDSLYLYLKSLLPDDIEIRRNDRSVLTGKEIDIYIPSLNIGFEYNGDYWHSDLKSEKYCHFNKTKLAQEHNVHLVHIWEYEWKDPQAQQKIKQFLKILLHKPDRKIYARNCEIKQISNVEARELNNSVHLQGHRNAQVTYGLYYKDELVQLMSFSRTKYNRNLQKDTEWEIIRGCPGSNNIVIGGVSKLFTHFVQEYKPTKVFSYCDFNKFNGKSYELLGMKFIGYTGPDLKYKLQDGTVVNRSPKNYKYNNEHCAYRMFGAGSKKYIWEAN